MIESLHRCAQIGDEVAEKDQLSLPMKEKSEKKGKSKSGNGTSTGVDVAQRDVSPDSGSSRPESRTARIEEVPDES